MRRLFTLFIIAAASAGFCVQARQLTPDQALQAARGDVSRMRANANPNMRTRLVYTAKQGDDNTYYVFNRGSNGGFIVVAADDVAVPLLGYADEGTFDPDNIPPQMQWWLAQYDAEISHAIASGSAAARAPQRTDASRHAVAPITKTLWNQDAPFNNQCPVLTSSSGTSQRAVTGCVATAMAQVMKVWNWPAQGIGSNHYNFSYAGQAYTETMDFGATTFDWDAMLDEYTSTSSAAANEAVATLMKSCGVGVNMSYGLAATGGSGAASFKAATALVNYFGYDKGIQYLSRENYDIADWQDILYNEVAAGRAVLYGGQSSEGGHEFVCDGYSSDNYFHFNWGWGGMSNGYFLLTALDPDSQGIGGSGNGYNMNQDIIIGIQPPQDGSRVVPSIALIGPFQPQQDSYYVGFGESIVFGTQEHNMYYSQSIANIDVTLGVKLTDASGNVQYVASSTSSDALPPQAGWYAFAIAPSAIPQGTFTITPAFRSGGEWYDVKCSIDNAPLTVTSDGEVVNFGTSSTGYNMQVTECSEVTPIYIGQPAEFTVTVEATGEFYGEVMPALVSNGRVIATGTPKGLSLNAGDSQTIDWVTDFEGSNLSAGQYNLVFIGENGESYSSQYPVTVNARQSVTPEVAVVSVTFNNATGAGTSSNPYNVDPENLSATITLEGETGYWADNVMGMVFSMSNGRSVSSFGNEFVGVNSGDTRTFTLTGTMDELTPDVTYMFVPWGSTTGQFTSNVTFIQCRTSTLIDNVTADADGQYTVYNLSGVAIKSGKGALGDATQGLAPGYYIVKRADSAQRVVVK